MNVYIEDNPRECINKAHELYEELLCKKESNIYMDNRNLPIEIKYGQGDFTNHIYIMTYSVYKEWCVGRVYWMDDQLYHGNKVVKYTRSK